MLRAHENPSLQIVSRDRTGNTFLGAGSILDRWSSVGVLVRRSINIIPEYIFPPTDRICGSAGGPCWRSAKNPSVSGKCPRWRPRAGLGPEQMTPRGFLGRKSLDSGTRPRCGPRAGPGPGKLLCSFRPPLCLFRHRYAHSVAIVPVSTAIGSVSPPAVLVSLPLCSFRRRCSWEGRRGWERVGDGEGGLGRVGEGGGELRKVREGGGG